MWAARIRQIENRIHLCCGQGYGRRRHPDIARGMVFTVGLDKATSITWVGFEVQHTVGVRIQNGVTLDLFITGQTNHASISWRHLVQTFAL